jgi:hypothetical protein
VRTYPGSGGVSRSSTYSNRSTVVLANDGWAWRITVPPDDYLLNDPKH